MPALCRAAAGGTSTACATVEILNMIYCNLAPSVPNGWAIGVVVNNIVSRVGSLDRLAIGLSGLCVVHCVASAIAVVLLTTAGGVLVDHRIHEIGLLLAIGLGIVALGFGIREHGFVMPAAVGALGIGMMIGAITLEHDGSEIMYTILGVAVLALGHDLNRRATN